jgi:hypothetical protein
MLGSILSGCYSGGCGSERCANEHAYATAKSCKTVLETSLIIVPAARWPSTPKFDASRIRTHAEDYVDMALGSGSKLGMRRDAILKDLEQAKLAYVNSYNSRTADPQHKLAELLGEVNRCVTPS